jgi:hypothetical protein
LGQPEYAHVAADGTWLEPDSLCYAEGGMNRRAYARCEDGVCRVVVCGLPDALFAIHGRTRIKGKSTGGYVCWDREGYKFLAYRT